MRGERESISDLRELVIDRCRAEQKLVQISNLTRELFYLMAKYEKKCGIPLFEKDYPYREPLDEVVKSVEQWKESNSPEFLPKPFRVVRGAWDWARQAEPFTDMQYSFAEDALAAYKAIRTGSQFIVDGAIGLERIVFPKDQLEGALETTGYLVEDLRVYQAHELP